MSGAAGDPRWFDPADDEPSVRALSRARTGRTTRPIAIVTGVLLAGVLATLGINRGDSGTDSPEVAEPADREVPVGPAPSATATEGTAAALAPDLERLDAVFRMVLRPEDGEGSVLLTIDPMAGSSVSALPDLGRFEFDSTGEWLAGLGVTRWGDRRRVLWAASTGEAMEPVAFDARTFAWHERRPGLIAYSDDDRTAVSIMDLTANEPVETVELPVEGRVRGYDDWGFAVETSPRTFTTAIVGPDGTLLHDGLPGTYRGTLPDGRIVLSGRRHALPFTFDPVTARIERLDGVAADAFVWRIADAEGSDRALAMVSHSGLRGAKFDGSIYSIDAGGRLEHRGDVHAFTDGDIDGSIAIFAQQADGQTPVSTGSVIGDAAAVLPFPADGGWIAVTSVP